jgi:hypothetical protein
MAFVRLETGREKLQGMVRLHYPQLHLCQIDRLTHYLLLNLLCLQFCRKRGLVQQQANCDFVESLRSCNSHYPGLLPAWPWTDVDANVLLSEATWLKDWLKQIETTSPITPELLGTIYEQSLRSTPLGTNTDSATTEVSRITNRRKSNGAYYTPAAITNFMVDKTLNPLPQRILDPSCGAGIFLLTAYQALLDTYLDCYLSNRSPQIEIDLENLVCCGIKGEWQLTYEAREWILLNYIHGIDIDSNAVEITRLALRLKLLETETGEKRRSLPDLSHTIQCGNALFDLEEQMAFPEVMSTGGFDLVIGNPPYLDAEGMTRCCPEWRQECNQRFQVAQGNWDLFCVFIERAWQLCKAGGLISLIVPNKLFSAEYATAARSLLVQSTQLLQLRDYSRVPVFQASVYPVVYIARKQSPQPQLQVQCEWMAELNRIESTAELPLERFDPTGQPWLLHPQTLPSQLMRRLQEYPRLEQLAQVTGAATVAEAYQLRSLIQEGQPEFADRKLINSGTIDRYCHLWGKKRLRYLGATYLYPVISSVALQQLSETRQWQAQQPKIIVSGMSRRLECAVDLSGTLLAGKSTSIITTSIALPYLLGILNSQLIDLWFTLCFQGNRLQGGYLRVGPPQLRQVPIRQLNLAQPSDRHLHDQMTQRVQRMLYLQQTYSMTGDVQERRSLQTQINQLDREIDELVFHLYSLSRAEIEIVEQVVHPER